MLNLIKIFISFLFLFNVSISFGQLQNSFGQQHIVNAEAYKKYLNYGNAIQSYEKGIQRFLDLWGEENSSIKINYINLGETFLEIGDIDNAKLYCENALPALDEEFLAKELTARCYECLGQAALYESNYDEAFDYYQKTLKLNEESWGKNSSSSSQLYLLLGEYHEKMDQFGLTRYYLEKIKMVNYNGEELEEKEYLGKYYEALGAFQNRQGYLDSAIASYNQGLEIYEQLYGKAAPAIARVYLRLGDLYYQKRAFDEALTFYNIPANSFEDNTSKNLKIVTVDSCHCNQILVAALAGQANVYEQKYYENGHQKDLQTALNRYEQATKKVNLAVKYYGKEAAQRRQVIHENKETFVSAIRVSKELYERTKDEKYIRQAFDQMTNYKGLTLQIEKKQASFIRNHIPEKILKEREKWTQEIISLEEQIYEATIQNLASLDELKQSLTRSKTGYATYLRNFKNTYYYMSDSIFASRLIEFDEVSALLNEETLLLNYVIDKSNNQLYILSFSKNEKDFKSVTLPKTFSKDIQSFYRLVQSSLLPRADKKEQYLKKGHELYELLIAPISTSLKDKKRLVIIRDDALHLLPFETLLTNKQSGKFSELPYLLKDFEISYHYSTGLWSNSLKQKWTGADNSLLTFAPVFDGDNHVENTFRAASSMRCYTDKLKQPLYYTEEEVKSIHGILGASPNSKMLLRENASEEAFKLELQEPHRFVHIATHSFANFDYAQFSGIACYSNDADSDPMMYINEIENLEIKTDLVVLSSCESGIGQLVKGEGLLGLNRSFLYAGVPNTIFSLWKVQDEATAILMVDFYKNIKLGKDYSKALQQAKLNMLKNSKTASPIFWSSFILMGR